MPPTRLEWLAAAVLGHRRRTALLLGAIFVVASLGTKDLLADMDTMAFFGSEDPAVTFTMALGTSSPRSQLSWSSAPSHHFFGPSGSIRFGCFAQAGGVIPTGAMQEPGIDPNGFLGSAC